MSVVDSIQSTEQATKLIQDIEQRVQLLWGRDVVLKCYEGLTERLSTVARVQLAGSRCPASVIVKHLPKDEYPALSSEAITHELVEESVCYEYLHSVRDHFSLFPTCYGFDSRGFLLLEDLAANEQSGEESLECLAERLARTMAQLHCATFGKTQAYQDLRTQAGLPEPQQDLRSYSLAAHRRRYRLGASTIKDYCNIMNVKVPENFHQHIDVIEAEMENPGIFTCFVHDDIANARQVLNRDENFYLIDFENAKVSHALLDLCKPLAGKFEMLIDSGEFFYANPNFPVLFIEVYRSELEARGHRYSEPQWDAALTHALLYHCIALVGKLIEISSDRRLRKPFAFDLHTILGRHLLLLEPLFTFSPISVALEELRQGLTPEAHI